ncbi:hypothetical protein J5U46_02195 [Micromonospora tulbaghiae]|uniref:DUF3040 domain-containing protein n=1 Tax=Micromonospora tulbaghiae TaxID=479978 RepID=A0AAW4JC55_9ACTN|nr:hypothetical protein [Micromonospora tulbaghiae]MBO4138965.1 hypothetical protein [Micromonospora tulbaghiae]MDX5459804.1 hypothetical protein [Micromonospora tulbaghiae]SCF13004.1 hypothetical protein GA0070562_0408 [Micromonospora tulbaghiae]
MVDSRGKSVGRYLMRLVGGVAVIFGLLGIFATLADGNLVGIVLSVVFIGGGVFLLKRSGPDKRADSVPRAAR